MFLQICGPIPVIAGGLRMLPTIQFDHQIRFQAEKVDDERPEGDLATELVAFELTQAKSTPKETLGICRSLP